MNLMGVLIVQMSLFWTFFDLIQSSINLPNIALNKATYMSSQFDPSTGSAKAVDGGKTPTYAGGQCAQSQGGQTALWRVDLGYLSSIHHIAIYPRTENSPWDETNGHLHRLLGFSVYVSNTTDKEDGSICFYDNEFYTPSTIPEIPTINCKMHGKYVIFYNERKQGQPSYYDPEAFVELCEFEVYGCLRNAYGQNCTGTCPVNCLNDLCDIISGTCFFCDIGFKGPRCENECNGGMYGPGCSSNCGACVNNTQCHHINGSCLHGCGPGYRGQKCGEECDNGMYGPGCSLTCGACINNTHCHHINGSCLQGCEPGYKGQKCDKECDGGKYGDGCSLTCGACINNTQCHHINGSCLHGCSPGYKGQMCDEECPSGTYGIYCRETCSVNCNVFQHCNRTTGECFGGCQPGWKGFHCDQICIQGTYGKDCQHRCGSCINQTHCHYVNGTCFEGCDTGYLGDKCVDENLKMESLCGKSNTIQILAISIAISIFLLLLGTILNITIWKRNQLKTRGKQSRHTTGNSDSAKPNLAESAYTELGAVNNYNAYDDLHHYSKAS